MVLILPRSQKKYFMANKFKGQKRVFNWQWLKKTSQLLIIACVLVFSVYVFYYLKNMTSIQLDKTIWHIENDYSLNLKDELLSRIKNQLTKKYFDIDLQKVRSQLLTHPWVAAVKIKRQLLDDIYLDITTHKIALRLNNNAYISKKGVLFIPRKKVTNSYPLALSSLTTQQNSKEIFAAFLQYRQILKPTQLRIKVIKQTPVTQLILQNNITLNLGYQQQIKRLQKFVTLYANLKKQKKLNFHTLDFRYKNGFVLSQPIKRL